MQAQASTPRIERDIHLITYHSAGTQKRRTTVRHSWRLEPISDQLLGSSFRNVAMNWLPCCGSTTHCLGDTWLMVFDALLSTLTLTQYSASRRSDQKVVLVWPSAFRIELFCWKPHIGRGTSVSATSFGDEGEQKNITFPPGSSAVSYDWILFIITFSSSSLSSR